jgi:pimeloyl-ACP methyl ester carboxylesterase
MRAAIDTALILIILAAACCHAEELAGPLLLPGIDYRKDIVYGSAAGTDGSKTTLKLDLYTISGDTGTQRPLVIFLHGGGLMNGDKVSRFGSRFCSAFAKTGFVTASINYRVAPNLRGAKSQFEAMIRAMQDARAAVRFFRKNAAVYGIDTSRIYAAGSSAGSVVALHMAFLDSAQVPSMVDWSAVGGTFEGKSGNEGCSSRINGVISNWGAIGDYRWITEKNIPVFCVHGTKDKSVPCDSSFSYGPFRYGSSVIYAAAEAGGIPSGLRLFPGAGHTLDNDQARQDSAIAESAAWLGRIAHLRTTNQAPSTVQGTTR